jgi:hypothetical protein
MKRKPILILTLITLIVMLIPSGGRASASPASAGTFTGYYNLIGYEGIGTIGSNLTSHGAVPPVGDYATTHCRYINVQNTGVGEYYLRYPLHLPNGSTITKVSLFVADFNSTGVLWAYLRSRPWNSRSYGTTTAFTLTGNTTNADTTIDMNSLNLAVNNQTSDYWVDVSPTNGTDPGQLCVYGIQVTYTTNGALLPLINNGG